MIAVIDYNTGNLKSVENALQRLGADFVITSDEAVVRLASGVLLPGVGEASSAMARLVSTGLDKVIPTLASPVLGICIGMQLMCVHSDEGDVDGMGIFRSPVVKFSPEDSSRNERIKIPQMGWNTVSAVSSPLFEDIPDQSWFYYVHSFYAEVCEDTVAVTTYGCRPFSATLRRNNFFGVQFHPEKSGTTGSKLLSNFLEMSRL